MPNFYEISPTDDTLALQDGSGEASFTVRYVGERPVEARAQVIPQEGAVGNWFELQEGATKDMTRGQTHTFKVRVSVPAGTPAGNYGLRLDMVSVDNTDEEYDEGPTVSFKVATSEPDKDKPGFPWWALIVIGLVLLLVIGVLAWWLTANGDDAPPKPDEQATPAHQVNVIDFRDFDHNGQTTASDLPGDWIKTLKVTPHGSYCSDARPAILPKGQYRLPFPVLSTATPGNLSRCNGVKLSFELNKPASSVSLQFFGAAKPYELRAYDHNNNLLGTDSASSTPYQYNSPSTVVVSTSGNPITHFEFGRQTALTLISVIKFTPKRRISHEVRETLRARDIVIPVDRLRLVPGQ